MQHVIRRTVRHVVLASGLLSSALGSAVPSWAQEPSRAVAPPPGGIAGVPALGSAGTAASPELRPAACGAQAALFSADRGLKVWVTRRGAAERDNPLRPLTPDRLVVLQVVVNGRLATAVGLDYDSLHQGRAPPQVERDMSQPIRWEPSVDGMPGLFTIVADDGTVMIGPMRFAECADAPAAKTVTAPASKTDPKGVRRQSREPRAGEPRTGEAAADRPNLPKGAIPSLSLPKGATN